MPLALSCTDQLRHLTLCILRAESKTTRSQIFISTCLLSQYSLRLVSLAIKSAFIFLAFWSHSTCHLYTSFSCPLGCCPVLPSFSTGAALFFLRPSFSSWSLARAAGRCLFPSSGRCSQLGFAPSSSGASPPTPLTSCFRACHTSPAPNLQKSLHRCVVDTADSHALTQGICPLPNSFLPQLLRPLSKVSALPLTLARG